MWEVWHVFQARNLAGHRELPAISGVHPEFPWDLDLLYLTDLPDIVYHPTEMRSWETGSTYSTGTGPQRHSHPSTEAYD